MVIGTSVFNQSTPHSYFPPLVITYLEPVVQSLPLLNCPSLLWFFPRCPLGVSFLSKTAQTSLVMSLVNSAE
jgi:hypothetical protein